MKPIINKRKKCSKCGRFLETCAEDGDICYYCELKYDAESWGKCFDAGMSGKEAYEEDLSRCPNYHDGSKRKTWAQLGELERRTWERSPTPRNYSHNRDVVDSVPTKEG